MKYTTIIIKNLLISTLLCLSYIHSINAETSLQAQRDVMIVLDASGSMWGQIDAKSKIDIARATIKEIIKKWDPASHLGLTVYGHRRKGDCNDIETLIPISVIDKNAYLKTLDGIIPKGKTPLSQAVINAAGSLKYTENRATVILISDGRETCDLDPCKVAQDLARKGVDFTTHVIGFDVSAEKDIKQLRCLAENTGGLFLAARNTNELRSALNETTRIVSEQPPQVMGVGNIWLDKTEFSVGDAISVHFEASSDFHSSAWIGIVPTIIEHGNEARNDRYDVAYQHLNNRTSGTLVFKTPGRIDRYDFRLHDTDHSGNEIASVSFTIKAARGNLKLDKTAFVTGEQIKLHFNTNVQLVSNAWVGIIPSNIPHGSEAINDQHDLTYKYLKGQTSGTFTFIAPSIPGSYDFRLHDTDANGNEMSSISFTVALASGRLNLNKTEFSPMESIQVTFTVPDGLAANAWVGIVPSNIPHGSEATNDQYDLSYQSLAKRATGTLIFKAPRQLGQYDFRLHDTDDNGTEISSISFVVK